MLELLRKSAGSWVIKILLMLIVVAFVLMGAGSFYAQQSTTVASVNGEPITVQEYQRAYQNITANLRNQFGGNLNDEIMKMFNVKKQALDALIEKSLLLQVARAHDMRIPNEFLADSITRIPVFQRDGAFDPELYKMVLSQNQLSPPEYETMQKEAMLTGKVRNFVSNTVTVSEAEAMAWFDWEKTSINIDYVVFTPADFANITISDDEIKKHYDEHKAEYKTEPKVKARYLEFSPEKFIADIKVSDEEIANYYSGHLSEFKTRETVSARHILVKIPDKATPETVEEKRKLAADIMEKAKSGKDFAALAKEYSEDPGSKDNGGDLGEFTREKMVQPFSEKAFSMGAGEISEPVRTQFGWHIIKVDAHRPEAVKLLEEAKKEIKDKLAAQTAKSLAYEKISNAYDISYDGDDLVRNAEDLGIEVLTTDFFAREDGPRGIDDPAAFASTAFELPLMEISNIKEIGDSYFLIQVVEKEEAKIPELETVKDKVTADAKRRKQNQAAREAAGEFLTKAKEAALAVAAKEAGITVKSSGLFTRNEPIPGIGSAQEITAAAFSRTPRSPVAESVLNHQENYYVIALKEHKAPETAAFEKDKSRIVSDLSMRKRQQTLDTWLKSMKENSEIEISDRLSE